MNQPDKNHEEKVMQEKKVDPKPDQQQDRLLHVGELKWSKEEDEKYNTSSEQKVSEEKEKRIENPSPKKESSQAASQKEVNKGKEETSATVTATAEGLSTEKKDDPLQNIEHTHTHMPIIEYSLDPENKGSAKATDEKSHSQVKESPRKILGITLTARKRKILKITWFPALLGFSLLLGLFVGHTIIGDEPFLDVFDVGMWQHLYQLLYG